MNYRLHAVAKRFAGLLISVLFCLQLEAQVGSGHVKIYILAGQSNMLGQGEMKPASKKGTLGYMAANDPDGPYGFVIDAAGGWASRDDVWYHSSRESADLTAGYGNDEGNEMGPELGFGHVVGNHSTNQVLLIKTAWGNQTLAVSFRPPSSSGDTGNRYTQVLDTVSDTIENLATYFPDYDPSQGYEIAGFAWHQGWTDRVNAPYITEYEENLVNFIRDIRRDLGSPFPFVIATTGQGGWEETDEDALALMTAQLNVAQYPEFAGNVTTVETRGFWREIEDSPTEQLHHWNRNALSYLDIGLAMGEAITNLVPARCPSALCAIAEDEGTTLSWNYGTDIPVCIQILRNGVEIESALAGDCQSYLDAEVEPGETDYELIFTMSGDPCDPLTVHITVPLVNDAPIADAQGLAVDVNGTVEIHLSGSDADGDRLTYTVVTQPVNGVLSGTAPNMTYTPHADYNGADSFTFSANDGYVDSVDVPVSIYVHGAVLAVWDFDAASEVAEIENPNLSTSFQPGAGGILSSSTAIGAGDTSNGAVAPFDALRFARGNGWDADDFSEAQANGDYFEFTVTPNDGVQISFEELMFSAAIRRAKYSPEVWTLTSSLDGHTAAIDTGTISTLVVQSSSDNTEVVGDFQDFAVDLSSVSFQEVTNAITFRIYINDDDSTDSSTSAATRYDGFMFTGSVVVGPVNGVPVAWLEQYGLERTTEETLADSDGDGLLNWEEYGAGTNPTNAASVLQVNGINRSGNQWTCDWQAVSEKTYSIWFKTNLCDSAWTRVTNGIPSVELAASSTIHMESPSGFIRIEVEP